MGTAASFDIDADNPVGSITHEMIERYNQDGVVMLRGAIHPEWLMLIEMGLGRVTRKGILGAFQEALGPRLFYVIS